MIDGDFYDTSEKFNLYSSKMSLDIELFRNLIWSNYEGIVNSIEKGANVNSKIRYPYVINKFPYEKSYDDFKLKCFDCSNQNSFTNIDMKVYSALDYAKLRVNDDRIIDLLIAKGAK